MSAVSDWDAAVAALGTARSGVIAQFPYDFDDPLSPITLATDGSQTFLVTMLIEAKDAIDNTLTVLQSGQGAKAYAALVKAGV